MEMQDIYDLRLSDDIRVPMASWYRHRDFRGLKEGMGKIVDRLYLDEKLVLKTPNSIRLICGPTCSAIGAIVGSGLELMASKGSLGATATVGAAVGAGVSDLLSRAVESISQEYEKTKLKRRVVKRTYERAKSIIGATAGEGAQRDS